MKKNYTRREFCGMLGSAVAGSFLLPGLSSAFGAARSGGRKKNVLFLPVDDLRLQLGCYGNKQVKSPNIDKLAADGILYERAYCQQAICGPSRASVLSGCRPDTTGVHWLSTPLREAQPDILTLPEHFRRNGYETISLGKVYHHRRDDLQGWTHEPYFTKGNWKGRGYMTAESQRVLAENDAKLAAMGKKSRGVGPAYEAFDGPDTSYHDGVNAQTAIKYLKTFADGGEKESTPFFMALGLKKPHLPFNAPKKYWDMYDRDKIDLAANPFAPDGCTEYSLTTYGELRQYMGIPNEGSIPEDMARTLIHGYMACVSYIDAQIGKVLTELDRLGLRDSTTIMLWGDHGWKLGEHDAWSKHTNFELDVHAPLIVSDPDMPKRGVRTDALVEFVDMYPTLCELCDLPVPGHLEGLSAAPLMSDPGKKWKSAAFSQFPRADKVEGYTMRTDRYRYTEWIKKDLNKVMARELYDHQKDSAENFNIAEKTANAELVAKLSKQLAAGWRAAKP